MAGPSVTDAQRAEILATYAATGNKTVTAERCNVDRGTVYKVLRAMAGQAAAPQPEPAPQATSASQSELLSMLAKLIQPAGVPPPPHVAVPETLPQPATTEAKPAPDCAPGAPTDFKHTESENVATVEYVVGRRIRTLEDAIAYAEVDTTVWRVKRWSCTAWEVGMKLRTFDDRGKVRGETPVVNGLWRISIELERVLPKLLLDATEAIFERMKGHAPSYPTLKPRQQPARPHLLEIDLWDCHFGKLAWEPEVGQNYDLKIADRIFRNAVDDLLDLSAGFEIDRVCLPIGNDFFHIDNRNGTTTAGTPQDVDGRYAKIYETGFAAVVWAVERLMAVANVDVLWIPGNHDTTISYHLAHGLKTWFRNTEAVQVDCSPKHRKYLRYGTCLLGYTHGDKEKVQGLPTLMATEDREAWGETTCHEWRIGHTHKSKQITTVPVDTHDGVVIRTMRSLSAIDAWHYSKGYGGPRSAEAYLLSREHGYVGHFVANARE